MYDRHTVQGAPTPQAPLHRGRLEQQWKELADNSCKFQALAKFLSFDDETAFDRALGRSGKSPYCLEQAPGGAPKAQHVSNKLPADHLRKVKNARAARKAVVEKARKDKEALLPFEVMEQLQEVFQSYCDKLVFLNTNRYEINIVGFCRLLRDCRLLDNRLTLVTADVVFTQVDAGGDHTSIAHDMSLDWGEFQLALQRLLHVKFPTAAGKPEDMVILLARNWVLPFHKGYQQVKAADAVFARDSLNMMRRYDKQFKRLYAWFATLPETEPSRVLWEHVRNTNATIGSSEFVLMAHCFQIMPALVSKNEVIKVFEVAEAENDGDGEADAMLYPAFLETFMALAAYVADFAKLRIPECTGSDDLKVFKRYIAGCPPPLGTRLSKVLKDTLVSRGRDYSDGTPPAKVYDEQIRVLKEQTDLMQQQEALFRSFNGVLKREDARQKFALTRLKNFYKDVRTGRNQGVWVPGQPAANTTGPLKESGHLPVTEPRTPTSAPSSNLVTFYSDSRQIKPPRAMANDAPWSMPPDSRCASKADLTEQFQAFLRSPGRHTSTAQGYSTLMPRSPKIYKLAPLEDVEESEAILQLVRTLPSIAHSSLNVDDEVPFTATNGVGKAAGQARRPLKGPVPPASASPPPPTDATTDDDERVTPRRNDSLPSIARRDEPGDARILAASASGRGTADDGTADSDVSALAPPRPTGDHGDGGTSGLPLLPVASMGEGGDSDGRDAGGTSSRSSAGPTPAAEASRTSLLSRGSCSSSQAPASAATAEVDRASSSSPPIKLPLLGGQALALRIMRHSCSEGPAPRAADRAAARGPGLRPRSVGNVGPTDSDWTQVQHLSD